MTSLVIPTNIQVHFTVNRQTSKVPHQHASLPPLPSYTGEGRGEGRMTLISPTDIQMHLTVNRQTSKVPHQHAFLLPLPSYTGEGRGEGRA